VTTSTVATETKTVTVHWIDGTSETYQGTTRVFEGVLHIYGHTAVHIPLANIRYWE
jgi:hypothetical protein